MSSGALALAFVAGLVATVNPCGFALLPAYLSYFLGLDDPAGTGGPAAGDGRDGSTGAGSDPVLRALAVSGVVTLGFVVVFGIMGIIWSSVSGWLGSRLPWFTAAVGVVLVGLGIAMLRGYEPVVNLPKLQLSRRGRQLSSMFLYGVSYAIASLSCTIGVFIAVTSTTLTDSSYLEGVATFLAYGLGMGVTLAVLTIAVALARQGVVSRFRSLLPHMNRISGVLLVIAGAFVTYYAWVEVQELNGGSSSSVVDWARDVQSALQRWAEDQGAARLLVAATLVIGGAVAVSLVWRRGRSSRPGTGTLSGAGDGEGSVESGPVGSGEPRSADGVGPGVQGPS